MIHLKFYDRHEILSVREKKRIMSIISSLRKIRYDKGNTNRGVAATFCNWFGSNGHPAVVPTHLSKPCSENTFCWQTRLWAAASDASQRHCHLKLAVTEQACRKLQERGMSARQKRASRVDPSPLEKRRRSSSPQAAFGAFARQPRRRRTVCLRRSWAMGLGRRVPHVTSPVLGARKRPGILARNLRHGREHAGLHSPARWGGRKQLAG